MGTKFGLNEEEAAGEWHWGYLLDENVTSKFMSAVCTFLKFTATQYFTLEIIIHVGRAQPPIEV